MRWDEALDEEIIKNINDAEVLDSISIVLQAKLQFLIQIIEDENVKNMIKNDPRTRIFF